MLLSTISPQRFITQTFARFQQGGRNGEQEAAPPQAPNGATQQVQSTASRRNNGSTYETMDCTRPFSSSLDPQHASDRLRNPTVFGRNGWQDVRYFNLSLAKFDLRRGVSRHSPSSVDSSDTRQRSIRAKWHKGTDALYHFARKRHAEAGTRTVAARIAPRPSPAPIAPEAEVGPCRRNRAVRFVVSGLRTNGQPKTGKSMRYNSRTGVRQPMPFRKHQVDCLRLWRLPCLRIL